VHLGARRQDDERQGTAAAGNLADLAGVGARKRTQRQDEGEGKGESLGSRES
jgi:hypothetical protein